MRRHKHLDGPAQHRQRVDVGEIGRAVEVVEAARGPAGKRRRVGRIRRRCGRREQLKGDPDVGLQRADIGRRVGHAQRAGARIGGRRARPAGHAHHGDQHRGAAGGVGRVVERVDGVLQRAEPEVEPAREGWDSKKEGIKKESGGGLVGRSTLLYLFYSLFNLF